MRKVKANFFISLDGVVESPDTWHFPYFNDEMLVHPIVVGEGKARLFPADEPQRPLELLSSETFRTGVVHLTYAPAQ